jgi:hypothetical protein
LNNNLPVRRHTLADWRTEMPQQLESGGAPTWALRTANFVTTVTPVNGDLQLNRPDNPDEYMLVIPPRLQATVQAGSQSIECDGDALFIVPPGASTVHLSGDGLVTRVFSSEAQDMAALASNHQDYANHPADLPEFSAWPMPQSGYQLRHYRLSEYSGAANISRIFRSRKLMLNVMDVYPAPRDPRKLKPHLHDDCEQITLALSGRFTHHLRAPWRIDSTDWRSDEHIDTLEVPRPWSFRPD